MNYKDFATAVAGIRNEKFTGDGPSAIEFALKRNNFVEAKLRKLIALAERTSFSTARRQQAGWRRELERTRTVRQRMETLRQPNSTARV